MMLADTVAAPAAASSPTSTATSAITAKNNNPNSEEAGDHDTDAAAAAAASDGADGEDDDALAAAQRVRHATYVDEIEGLDDNCCQTLAAVYERGEQAAFAALLAARTAQHERAIERTCRGHYQGFVVAVRQLLLVRDDVGALRRGVASLQRGLGDASRSLLERGAALQQCRRVQVNIAAAAAALRSCLGPLHTFAQLQRQLEQRQLHRALVTVEQLRGQLQLPPPAHQQQRTARHLFRLLHTIGQQLPAISDSLRAAAMSDLKDYLEAVRREAPRLGRVAMRAAAVAVAPPLPEHSCAGTQNTGLVPSCQPAPPDDLHMSGSTVASVPAAQLQTEQQEEEEAGLEGEEGAVDCAPLYRCWHVQRALGCADQFAEYYRRQRRQQALLECGGEGVRSDGEGGRSGGAMLAALAGFLQLEEQVALTCDGLLSLGQLQQLWSDQLAPALVTQLQQLLVAQLSTPGQLQLLRRQLVVFCQLLEARQLSAQPVAALLPQLHAQHQQLLLRHWTPLVEQLLAEDQLVPLELATADEFELVAAAFPAGHVLTPAVDNDPASATSGDWPYPRRLPFSLMVPRLFCCVRRFLAACAAGGAAAAGGATASERDESLRAAVNALFARCLRPALFGAVARSGQGLLPLMQLTVNVNQLWQAAAQLPQLVAQLSGFERRRRLAARVQTTLVAQSLLTDLRQHAAKQLIASLCLKIDQILEMGAYDWQLAESSGAATSSVLDLLDFLRSALSTAAARLPAPLAATVCVAGCEHVALVLAAPLVAATASPVSEGALQQLSLDLMQCEQLVMQLPQQLVGVSDASVASDNHRLLGCFQQLRQLLDLLLAWDWQVYVDQFSRARDGGAAGARYGLVSPALCASVVEKLRLHSDRRRVFSVLSRADRDRRKMHDAVLRQLRQLQETDSAPPAAAAAGTS